MLRRDCPTGSTNVNCAWRCRSGLNIGSDPIRPTCGLTLPNNLISINMIGVKNIIAPSMSRLRRSLTARGIRFDTYTK